MSDIFIRALEKTGIRDDEDSLKIFANIVDFVGQIEPYTLFTKRSISAIEEHIFNNLDYISFVLSTNMFLRGLMELNLEDSDSVSAIIHGMIISMVPTNNHLTDKSLSDDFLNQLNSDTSAIELRGLVVNSWYKVIVLMVYYQPEVFDLVKSLNVP